jgi:hypothetical protein
VSAFGGGRARVNETRTETSMTASTRRPSHAARRPPGPPNTAALRLPKASSVRFRRRVDTRGGCRRVGGVVVCRGG